MASGTGSPASFLDLQQSEVVSAVRKSELIICYREVPQVGKHGFPA